MRPDARLHADQARWNIGEPRIDLAARQLMTQNDRAFVVETDDMECVLADVDADRGDDASAGSCAWHGIAPDSRSPMQAFGCVRREHGGLHPISGHRRLRIAAVQLPISSV